MKIETLHLQLITPCFSGGAEPEREAEIRAPTIRGQLRWWFRTLGGFSSLAPMPVSQQEAMIFGSTAGDQGQAGNLAVRVTNSPGLSLVTKDDEQFHAQVSTDRGYLAFPLRSKREKHTRKLLEYKGRAVFDCEGRTGKTMDLPSFDLEIVWRGPASLRPDIMALVGLLGHLGSLGFRSRRAFGALRLVKQPSGLSLKECLKRLMIEDASGNKRICVFKVIKRPGETQEAKHTNANECIITLARWLKDWRSHGRTVDHSSARPPNPPHNTGFTPYAENDHNRGVDAGERSGSPTDVTYRPALGLPILQFFSSGRPQVDWNESFDGHKLRRNPRYSGEGRFASPVLLRPHRDEHGDWHALVIFVDAHRWPNDPATGRPKQVFLNGQPRGVSLDLYETMKRDPNLASFP